MKKLLDFVFSKIPDLKLDWISLGNEVDATLGNEAANWEAYSRFFVGAKKEVKMHRSNLLVGVKTTMTASFGVAAAQVAKINEKADLVLITYYPLKSDYTFLEPSVVIPDMDRLCAKYSGRRIDLAEFGYPSGTASGSSPAKQADFYRFFFKAWDKHAKQIRLSLVDWQTDLSPSTLVAFCGYYGVSSSAFVDFLGTLGLREWAGSGKDKPAWAALKTETRVRGW